MFVMSLGPPVTLAVLLKEAAVKYAAATLSCPLT